MNKLSLILALIGVVAALPAQASADASPLEAAELRWSDSHGDYVPVRVLGDDPFQEKLVWSDRHGDYIGAAMASADSMAAYQLELVWSDYHGDYLPRADLVPCPSIASVAPPQRLAALPF